jgi:hypothetical protein
MLVFRKAYWSDMTPQSSFMVVAPIDPGKMAELKALLGSMNMIGFPGMAESGKSVRPLRKLCKPALRTFRHSGRSDA